MVDITASNRLLGREFRKQFREILVPETNLSFFFRASQKERISSTTSELEERLNFGSFIVKLDYLVNLSRVKVDYVQTSTVSSYEYICRLASSILVNVEAYTAVVEDSTTRCVVESD